MMALCQSKYIEKVQIKLSKKNAKIQACEISDFNLISDFFVVENCSFFSLFSVFQPFFSLS